MNKVYTIGRDTSCDIVIADSSDVVSRVHASLKANGGGKYTIIDQSRNGTYVNGIRMSANEEIPVTRKDVISFAHVRDLDWNQIPKDKNTNLIWIIAAVAVVLAVGACFLIFKPKTEQPKPAPAPKEVPAQVDEPKVVENTSPKDTVYVKPKQEVKQKTKKKKNEVKQEEKQSKEEPEVVNPLL